VAWLCATLQVTRGGFYAWLQRPESARSQLDTQLTAAIRTSFAESDRTYGARRVRRDLHAWGHPCGIHRVHRLMRRAELVARPRRRRLPFDTGPRPEHSIAPNILDRQFAARSANSKWAADFTYLWTAEGWLYVAVVLDLFSRRVVGWSMSAQMTAQLVTDAMLMAIWRRGPTSALLHHSDQGSQGDFHRSSQHLNIGGVVWDDHQGGLQDGRDGHRCGRQADQVSISGKLSRHSGSVSRQELRARTRHWRAAYRSRLVRAGFERPAGWRPSVWRPARADTCHSLNAKNSRY
jgi:putative transposase